MCSLAQNVNKSVHSNFSRHSINLKCFVLFCDSQIGQKEVWITDYTKKTWFHSKSLLRPAVLAPTIFSHRQRKKSSGYYLAKHRHTYLHSQSQQHLRGLQKLQRYPYTSLKYSPARTQYPMVNLNEVMDGESLIDK